MGGHIKSLSTSNSSISKYYRNEEDELSCESLYLWLVSPFDFTQDKLCEGSLLRVVRELLPTRVRRTLAPHLSLTGRCQGGASAGECCSAQRDMNINFIQTVNILSCYPPQSRQKALTLPSPNGRGEATLIKFHLNRGEVVFEIKVAT